MPVISQNGGSRSTHGEPEANFPSLKTWHKSFRLRWRAGGHRLNFDLHRAGGLYAWIVLFTVSLSGLSFNLREPFKAAVAWVSPLTPAYGDVARRPAVPLENPLLGFEDAIRIATAVRPGLQARRCRLCARLRPLPGQTSG
ncbi:PepSY domain-containing protein [Methylocaldum marinum]|uniref:PepSY domain-containing protein n=1 Tax=Methylocaldum marinum TaxID=1432792 RepID=UPI0014766133